MNTFALKKNKDTIDDFIHAHGDVSFWLALVPETLLGGDPIDVWGF